MTQEYVADKIDKRKKKNKRRQQLETKAKTPLVGGVRVVGVGGWLWGLRAQAVTFTPPTIRLLPLRRR